MPNLWPAPCLDDVAGDSKSSRGVQASVGRTLPDIGAGPNGNSVGPQPGTPVPDVGTAVPDAGGAVIGRRAVTGRGTVTGQGTINGQLVQFAFAESFVCRARYGVDLGLFSSTDEWKADRLRSTVAAGGK